MLELAFDGQMHFGCFYAHVKLKEQVRVSYHKSRGTLPPAMSAADQPKGGRSVRRRCAGVSFADLFFVSIRARWERIVPQTPIRYPHVFALC